MFLNISESIIQITKKKKTHNVTKIIKSKALLEKSKNWNETFFSKSAFQWNVHEILQMKKEHFEVSCYETIFQFSVKSRTFSCDSFPEKAPIQEYVYSESGCFHWVVVVVVDLRNSGCYSSRLVPQDLPEIVWMMMAMMTVIMVKTDADVNDPERYRNDLQ